MNEILTAAIGLCGISLALTLLILAVDATLGNYGECRITINGDAKSVSVRGGQSLLSSLGSVGIFIPSACGGKGSCGLCKLRVVSGTDEEPLPTELPWLTPEEVRKRIRLSCQVKVRGDLSIEIPDEYFSVREYRCVVESLKDLTHDIKEVRLRLKEPDSIEFKAGQFIQLRTPVYKLSRQEVYRAYSISSPPSDRSLVELEIRLVPNGICTTYVHRFLKEGEEMLINGPHGDFHLRPTEADIVFVAGGSGMAPIKSILLDMRERGSRRNATYFFGALSKRDLFQVETMRQLESEMPTFRFVPALSRPTPEDGWNGETGLITDVIARTFSLRRETEAYLCGSPGMIDACVRVLRDKGIPEERIYYDKFA
jgi:Na+-transporting NADH:ubiquinone oxidoreductase subunit F